MKRLRDYLLESRDAPLYQMVQRKKAEYIFSTDSMPARHIHDIPRYGKVMGNSFTRNSKLVWWGVVWLQINQTRLRQRHKIIPVDGEYVLSVMRGAKLDNDNRDRISEHLSEEFVVGDIVHLHYYITKITMRYSNAFRLLSRIDILTLHKLVNDYANNWNIPLEIDQEITRVIGL